MAKLGTTLEKRHAIEGRVWCIPKSSCAAEGQPQWRQGSPAWSAPGSGQLTATI